MASVGLCLCRQMIFLFPRILIFLFNSDFLALSGFPIFAWELSRYNRMGVNDRTHLIVSLASKGLPSFVAWCQVLIVLYFQISCPCFSDVSSGRVNLVPVIPSCLEVEDCNLVLVKYTDINQMTLMELGCILMPFVPICSL